ncbi:MAG: FitA-like ribbon-helix-helix domain-containing protein [Actinomycetota bacterium]
MHVQSAPDARTIQIRNVPEGIHRTLRSRAAAAGVSLSEYLLREIVRVAERPPLADVLMRAESRHGGADPEAIVAAVRSGRDRF